MGYPVAQGPLPKMRQSCTNLSSVLSDFAWSSTLFHCSNLHPQHGKQCCTNLFCGVEHGPRGLVWERKLFIKQKKVSVSFKMPLRFTTKQVWRISVISFCFPAMRNCVSGNATFILNLSVNTRSNIPSTTDNFDANRLTYNTVGWLSLNTATWYPDFTLYNSSITSHSNKSPAIYKIEFFHVPVQLELETISLFTHSSHYMRNTVGVHGNFLSKTALPIPWPDTSFTPL